MPYFTTVEGKFTQLCLYTAQDLPCPETKCEFFHEPKSRRICPLFHNPRERCPHNPCYLGHDEARQALKASKAFGRCSRLAAQQEEILRRTNQNQETDLKPPADNATQKGNEIQIQPASKTKDQSAEAEAIPKPTESKPGQPIQAVHFEQLVQDNTKTGQQDEMRRIYLLTESLKNDLEAFKKQAADKEKEKELEARSLQSAMGDMANENERLRQENESKPSLLDSYYQNVLEKSSGTRALLDLNKTPPLESAIEGTLVVLATMYGKPIEFAGASKTIDLFNDRPITRVTAPILRVPDEGTLGAEKHLEAHLDKLLE
jgi:hypothetical protein